MLTKKFQKRKEAFICEKCRFEVFGNGYTNHCPKCLWSKHVDKNPGDRTEKCKGLMRPVAVELRKGGRYFILHKCIKCGFGRYNSVRDEDDFEAVINISKNNKAGH